MKKLLFIFIGIALLGCTSSNKGACPFKEIGTMPHFEQGYEQGVSACYAAIYDGYIYIAGGCNFPTIPAAEGGSKRYYRGIYRAMLGDTLTWEKASLLPEASAYGVSVTNGSKWYIAGGNDEKQSTQAVYCIDLADNCHIDTLPPLPCTIDNAAGAFAGGKLFIAGGNASGKPSARVFMLDIANKSKSWSELPTPPSRPRIQPACASTDKALYIWSGFCPADSCSPATVHTDGLSYDYSQKSWSTLQHIAPGNNKISLSGGTATALNNTTIIAVGGVNSEIFTDAISGKYSLISKEEYMLQPAEWYRFNPHALQYNTQNNSWQIIYSDPSFARAGAIVIHNDDAIYYIGGELKPGIRTPQIHRLTIE